MEKDPVCGMNIEKESAEAKFDYENKTYYFCSTECHDLFVKNPKKYLRGSGGKA